MTTSASTAGEGATLPIAVIGAGPMGLVAASHIIRSGATPLVLEAGEAAGASVREWAHVRLFTPWKYLTDPVSRGLLAEVDWTAPDGEAYPTGGDFVRQFLKPLGEHPLLARHIHLDRRVIGVSRQGIDKATTSGRDEAPFELQVRSADGTMLRYLARAVIDASGTFATPNTLGSRGLPMEGERELADRVRYGLPDVLHRERERYAGRRILVVGSGHSAAHAVVDLAALSSQERGGDVVWAVRREHMAANGTGDVLPARQSLVDAAERLVEKGQVARVTGFRAGRLIPEGEQVLLEGLDGRVIGPVDEVIVATGFRPELGMLRELRLGLDPALEAPAHLAPLIDPQVHSCETVQPHGHAELSHPEDAFFIVGMKSYGRAPTFLLATGFEQVRSVVAALSGDMAAARDVRPQVGGACTSVGASSCCSPGPQAADASGALGSTCLPPARSGGIARARVAPAARGGSCCG